MTKVEIIKALVTGEFDHEQTGIWNISEELFDLTVIFGHEFTWHGRFKAGTYFYYYTDDLEIVDKYSWDMYGARKPEEQERIDAGIVEHVCLARISE